MNILVQNTTILAVNVIDYGDRWETPDQIIPKHIVPGAVVVDAGPLPDGFLPCRYSYSNGAVVLNSPTAEESNSYCTECCRAVDTLFLSKLYTNISCVFPSGNKVVQFRDDNDRANLVNVAQRAQYLISVGTPLETDEFRTEDNVWQTLSAADFMVIANYIFTEKQAIKKAATDHKDALSAMAASGGMSGMTNYDITTGWPV